MEKAPRPDKQRARSAQNSQLHGLIFISFRDYLAAIHGAASERRVTEGEPRYLLSEAYPDERFERLVEQAPVS
jgi:hypothetical protein